MERGAAVEPPRRADGEAAEVFLSFSSVDRETAKRVEVMIEGLGLRCWSFVSDQDAGSYSAHITNAIDACRIVVLVLTPASNASEAVQREIALAGQRGRLIMPLCEAPGFDLAPGLEYWIRPLHWPASLEELERLLRKEALAPPSPPVPPADGTAAEATTTAAKTTTTVAKATTTAAKTTTTKHTGWQWWGYLLIGVALLGFLVVISQVFCAPPEAQSDRPLAETGGNP